MKLFTFIALLLALSVPTFAQDVYDTHGVQQNGGSTDGGGADSIPADNPRASAPAAAQQATTPSSRNGNNGANGTVHSSDPAYPIVIKGGKAAEDDSRQIAREAARETVQEYSRRNARRSTSSHRRNTVSTKKETVNHYYTTASSDMSWLFWLLAPLLIIAAIAAAIYLAGKPRSLNVNVNLTGLNLVPQPQAPPAPRFATNANVARGNPYAGMIGGGRGTRP